MAEEDLPPSLRNVLEKLAREEEVSDKELSNAFAELRRNFFKVGDVLLSARLPLYEMIRLGIEMADEDLFFACEEHDSLRRIVYKVVRMMSWESLEKASKEILSKDLERTLLGAFIMRRLGGRGGGT